MKKYISIAFVGMLLLIPTVLAEPSASASRSIEHKNLTAGGSTHVTVTISSSLSQPLSLMETPPSGWKLVRVSDDAINFKNSTNEWVWSKIDAGMTKTVVYRLDSPSNANPGTYNIKGSITNSSGIIASVTGESTVDVITPGVISSGSTTWTATPTATVKTTSNVTPTAAVTSTPTASVTITPAVTTPVVTTAAPGFTSLITIATVVGMIMLLLHRRRYK